MTEHSFMLISDLLTDRIARLQSSLSEVEWGELYLSKSRIKLIKEESDHYKEALKTLRELFYD